MSEPEGMFFIEKRFDKWHLFKRNIIAPGTEVHPWNLCELSDFDHAGETTRKLIVDALNSHASLTAENAQLREAANTVALKHAADFNRWNSKNVEQCEENVRLRELCELLVICWGFYVGDDYYESQQVEAKLHHMDRAILPDLEREF